MSWWPEEEEYDERNFDDSSFNHCASDLVFAVDILSPHKLVTMDGKATFFGGWSTWVAEDESYGVLIHRGEPVNEYTMEIVRISGIRLPLPMSYFRREPVIHEGKYL